MLCRKFRSSHAYGLWLDFYSLALARGKKTHNELDKNHIQPQTMGDSFYYVTTPFLSLHYLTYNPLRRHRNGKWKINPMGDIHRK